LSIKGGGLRTSDPRASLLLYVFSEWSLEVVSAAAAALLRVGGDDVGIAQFEFLQIGAERLGERSGSLLIVL
jgi:hypothetical protein